MILKAETEIEANETAGELHDRLMDLGKDTVLKTLRLIETGKAETTIQSLDEEVKTAYKLNKENCKIDWTKPGEEIHNLVRGLSPYPAAWCFIKDNGQEWNVKIYETIFEKVSHNEKAGTLTADKKEIKIAAINGFIKIKRLQFPGKKRMTAQELLNGMVFSKDAIAW